MKGDLSPEHLRGFTAHARKGALKNAFRYGVDYVLIDAEAEGAKTPLLFSRNRANLAAIHDRDHGGAPGRGAGAAWARAVLSAHGLPVPARIRLLAQPRVLGHVFNPVSFFLAEDEAGALLAVIAEVTNTYGDRHSYLCHHEDHCPILPGDRLGARKAMHVSPFQPIAGGYNFHFDLQADRIGIVIDYDDGAGGGVYAALSGQRRPLTSLGLLGAALRRPLGSRRVLALIHWQALKLWLKGAAFRGRPLPPDGEVSR